MRRLRKSMIAGGTALLAALGGVVLFALPASAHGAMQIPGSRTWLCYEDALQPTGELIPQNPACAQAVAGSGLTPLYNWFAVANNQGTTSGETTALIPDGKLCSGNSNYFDFSGFDAASPDWPKTHLTSGSTIQIRYNKWAAHPGTFSLYITKPGWDSSKPLTWEDLEPMPFSQATDPPSVGNPGSVDSYYYWNATLPSGYSGNQIIYSIWARSDSTETFYGCSDVVFDGGDGTVTGVGGSANPAPTPTPTPTPTPGGTPSCTAAYSVTGSWSGGFQGQVTVANTGGAPTNDWTVSWPLASGETISSLWNGTLSTSGSQATVTAADYDRQIPAGGSTSFGFTASQAASPAVPAVTCQSS